MNQAGKRTRFEERIRLEREFLAPVNRRFGARAALTGMTGEAISSWEQRAKAASSAAQITEIASLLREASARAELLADNSRDVFTPERRISRDGIGEIRQLLERLLH